MKFKNKIDAAFGSCGWSGEFVERIEEHFHRCGIAVAEGIRVKRQPNSDDLSNSRNLEKKIGWAIKDNFE